MISPSAIFSSLGLAVLALRIGPAAWSTLRRGRVENEQAASDAFVSILIPVRNEENHLPRLLTSLMRLDHRQIEILVIDDASSDRSVEISREFAARDSRIRVIEAPVKPGGWVGKTWACFHGAAEARGEFLLFTDADTEHESNGLSRALAQMRREDADLLSAIPFHENETSFDPYAGPFHVLTLIAASAFSKPRLKRVFAIGQYLLFRRELYFALGTHESVKMSFCEDVDFAELCLARGGRFSLNRSGAIFRVRMYLTFRGFFEGWRRIFRIGFAHARPAVAVEVFLVIACLTESFRFSRATPIEVGCAVAGLVLIGVAQSKYGRFSWLGVLAAPVSLALFTTVALVAFIDRVGGRDLRWRGRSYKIEA